MKTVSKYLLALIFVPVLGFSSTEVIVACLAYDANPILIVSKINEGKVVTTMREITTVGCNKEFYKVKLPDASLYREVEDEE